MNIIVGFSIEYRKLKGHDVIPSSMSDPDAFLALYVREQKEAGQEDTWLADAPISGRKHLISLLRGFCDWYDIELNTAAV
jgi:hypothetical protein